MSGEGALSSDEVNFLIYRYLLEAGFTHTSFVFGCESTVTQANIEGKDVPVGALVTFIQKGFQLMELEANLNEDGSDVYGQYVGLSARDILTKDIKELREAARDLKLRDAAEAAQHPAAGGGSMPLAAPAPAAGSAAPACIEIPEGARRKLTGHTQAVNSLSWSTSAGKLATASDDGTARVWNAETGSANAVYRSASGEEGADTSNSNTSSSCAMMLAEWSPDGRLLAGLSVGGEATIWESSTGRSIATLPPQGTAGPAVCLAWSRDGRYIARGSADGAVVVFEAATGVPQNEWRLSGGSAIYDVSWQGATVLAAAGQSGEVAQLRVGEAAPLCVVKAHGLTTDMSMDDPGPPPSMVAVASGSMDAVNAVAWNSEGTLLASASNDMTVAVWGSDLSFEAGPRCVLKGHKREVDCLAWAPESCSKHIDKDRDREGRSARERGDKQSVRGGGLFVSLLASGSQDGSVRLWDATSCTCIAVLDRHEGAISGISWSSDGRRVAVGDADGNVTVWERVDEGYASGGWAMVRTMRGLGGVTGLQWLKDDNTLAVGFADCFDVMVVDVSAVGAST